VRGDPACDRLALIPVCMCVRAQHQQQHKRSATRGLCAQSHSARARQKAALHGAGLALRAQPRSAAAAHTHV
jgi:hypothetical protein